MNCGDMIRRTERDGVRVSTVFLAIDHNFDNMDKPMAVAPPVMWETMVFGGKYDGECERYNSLHGAVIGHMEFESKFLPRRKISWWKRILRLT